MNYYFDFSGLWNQIFLGTYTALFLAMPFAYFFTESEGLAGSRKVLFQNHLLHVTSFTKVFVMHHSPRY